jgi:hypothetical protein
MKKNLVLRNFIWGCMFGMTAEYMFRVRFYWFLPVLLLVILIQFAWDFLIQRSKDIRNKEIQKHCVNTINVTRTEVIDHTKTLEEGGGRVFVKHNCPKVELQLQDNNKTLKIFISKLKIYEQESKESK